MDEEAVHGIIELFIHEVHYGRKMFDRKSDGPPRFIMYGGDEAFAAVPEFHSVNHGIRDMDHGCLRRIE